MRRERAGSDREGQLEAIETVLPQQEVVDLISAGYGLNRLWSGAGYEPRINLQGRARVRLPRPRLCLTESIN